MKNLNEISDAELQSKLNELKLEVSKRAKEARLKLIEEIQVRNSQLTIEAVDQFVPEHGRTSCSDSDISNGFDSNANGIPRCNRCALLEIVNGMWNTEMQMLVSIDWKKI